MSKLSTHVLNTSTGKPASGVKIDLSIRGSEGFKLIKSVITNADGRTDELLLDSDSMQAGDYELLFYMGNYFADGNRQSDGAFFLNHVPVHFTISDPKEDYHVPLLVSPWAYATYRGS